MPEVGVSAFLLFYCCSIIYCYWYFVFNYIASVLITYSKPPWLVERRSRNVFNLLTAIIIIIIIIDAYDLNCTMKNYPGAFTKLLDKSCPEKRYREKGQHWLPPHQFFLWPAAHTLPSWFIQCLATGMDNGTQEFFQPVLSLLLTSLTFPYHLFMQAELKRISCKSYKNHVPLKETICST